jgi:hypothetical protein
VPPGRTAGPAGAAEPFADDDVTDPHLPVTREPEPADELRPAREPGSADESRPARKPGGRPGGKAAGKAAKPPPLDEPMDAADEWISLLKTDPAED